MNAAIRAVTRRAIYHGVVIFGIRRGYAGLIQSDFVSLWRADVGEIIMQLGGTMLGSARSEEFKTDEGLSKAARNLHERNVEGLIVIGGNASQAGASACGKRLQGQSEGRVRDSAFARKRSIIC